MFSLTPISLIFNNSYENFTSKSCNITLKENIEYIDQVLQNNNIIVYNSYYWRKL